MYIIEALIIFFLFSLPLRMELNAAEEAIQALRNLVLLVGSLTTCGYIELKPGTASSGSLFQMPGFFVPQPTGKGECPSHFMRGPRGG